MGKHQKVRALMLTAREKREKAEFWSDGVVEWWEAALL